VECNEEFASIFRSLILTAGKVVYHNNTAIAIAAILDTRMKGADLMDALVKVKAYGVITKELQDQGAIQEAAVQVEAESVPEKSIIILINNSYNICKTSILRI
jgi:hypothetical protein